MTSERTPTPADGFPHPLAGFDRDTFKLKEQAAVSGSPKQFGLFVRSERIGANTSKARFVLPVFTNLDAADSQASVLVHIFAPSSEHIGEIQALSLPGGRTLLQLKAEEGSDRLWSESWRSLLAEMKRKGWEFYSDENLAVTRHPGSPGLGDEELAYRFSKVILAETIKGKDPTRTWKDLCDEVGFDHGGTKDSNYRLFLDAKSKLERARENEETGLLRLAKNLGEEEEKQIK